jgi:hypothetical protein
MHWCFCDKLSCAAFYGSTQRASWTVNSKASQEWRGAVILFALRRSRCLEHLQAKDTSPLWSSYSLAYCGSRHHETELHHCHIACGILNQGMEHSAVSSWLKPPDNKNLCGYPSLFLNLLSSHSYFCLTSYEPQCLPPILTSILPPMSLSAFLPFLPSLCWRWQARIMSLKPILLQLLKYLFWYCA